MKNLTKDEQVSKSYDYISNVFNKQGRVMPFELCYGDGSIHGQLSMDDVKVIWAQMAAYLTNVG